MNERTIAIGFEEMREIPNRVGVSGGISEASANIRAVRAGLLNVLITDEDTAAGMLAILNAEGSAAGWKPRGRAPRPWSLVESWVAPCEYGRCFPEREVILCSRSC